MTCPCLPELVCPDACLSRTFLSAALIKTYFARKSAVQAVNGVKINVAGTNCVVTCIRLSFKAVALDKDTCYCVDNFRGLQKQEQYTSGNDILSVLSLDAALPKPDG